MRTIYLEREGNSKDQGFERQGLPEGAVAASVTDLGQRGGFYIEVSIKLWILHPQGLQEFDSGSFINAVFLSTA